MLYLKELFPYLLLYDQSFQQSLVIFRNLRKFMETTLLLHNSADGNFIAYDSSLLKIKKETIFFKQ